MNKIQFGFSLLILWLSHLMMDFMLGVWNVYKTLMGLDLVLAGLMATLAGLIGEGSQLFFGYLSDRGWNRRLIMLGVGLTSMVPFLVYFDHPGILFLFLLCAFIGSGAFHPSALNTMLNISTSYRSVLITLFASGGMVGAALSQYMFAYTYQTFNGHTWMLVIPTLMLITACYFFKFPKITNVTSGQQKNFSKMLNDLKPYRKNLILLYLVAASLQIVVMSFSFMLPEILQAKGCEQWLCLGGGYFYLIIGAAIASLPMGYCVDRFGYKPVLTSIIVSSMISLSVFLRIESLTIAPIIVLLLLIGATLTVFVPIVVSGANRLVPSHVSGFISGLYMGGVSCTAAISPVLSGMITTYVTGHPITTLETMSLLLVVAFSLMYFLPSEANEKVVIVD